MSGGIEPTLSRRRALGLLGGAAALGALGACSSGRDDDGRRADSPSTERVPPPVGFRRTRWAADPWALGAYSYLPVGATPSLRATLAEPIDGWLHLAGEALSTEAPATVHGARAAGGAAADAVLAADDEAAVVVVGAGAAGAAAARVLAEAGLEVVVVEARDRTGGRIATTEPAGWPIPVELGASFVHDVDASESADRLAALEVAAAPFTYATSYLGRRDRRLADGDEAYASGYAALEAAVAWADEGDADTSLATALDRSGAADEADADGLALARHSEVEVELGVDAADLSAWWGLDEGTTGDDLIVVGGYGALVDADLDGIDVRLEWPVESIDLTGDRIVLTADDGRTIAADQVVVTVPLAVLAAEVISFTPPLPDAHRQAIAGLGTGLLDKVWLRWDEPWWTDEAEVWSTVDGPFEWCNLLPATGEPVLLAFLGGSAAREWSGRSDDDLQAAALADLTRLRAASW